MNEKTEEVETKEETKELAFAEEKIKFMTGRIKKCRRRGCSGRGFSGRYKGGKHDGQKVWCKCVKKAAQVWGRKLYAEGHEGLARKAATEPKEGHHD